MPTTRQIIAVKKLAEILRNAKKQKGVTIQKILKEAGYSDNMARASTQVTQSKGFKSLMEQYLPLELGHKIHSELLQSATHDNYRIDAKFSDKEIEGIVEAIPGCKLIKIRRNKGESYCTAYYWSPDSQARSKAVDMLYKIYGTYAPEKQEHKITGIKVINYGNKKG